MESFPLYPLWLSYRIISSITKYQADNPQPISFSSPSHYSWVLQWVEPFFLSLLLPLTSSQLSCHLQAFTYCLLTVNFEDYFQQTPRIWILFDKIKTIVLSYLRVCLVETTKWKMPEKITDVKELLLQDIIIIAIFIISYCQYPTVPSLLNFIMWKNTYRKKYSVSKHWYYLWFRYTLGVLENTLQG